MIVRIVRLRFLPNEVKAFESLMESFAEDIRAQPGCLHLDILLDREDELAKVTLSHWENEESLDAYRASDLFGQVWPQAKKMFSAPPEVWTFEKAIEG